MSKIGDLIVRLQLKYQDYEKGLKKANQDTKGFASGLNKGIGKIKAAWAAVGVAVVAAAKKMVSEMAKASNNVGDFMNVKARQIGAVWQTMITSITAGFDNFLARAETSARAAKALQEMEDAEFEMLNSVKLRRAELEQQLVRWEIESKDATKSYEDRKKAADKYLSTVKEIYQIEIDYYKKLAQQSSATWLQQASTPTGSILGYSESNAGALYQFLKDYGADTGLQDAVKNYREAWKEAGELWNRTEQGKNALRWVNENRQDMGQTNYRRFALDLGWAYEEQKNDDLNGAKLVDNIEKYLKALAAFDSETKRMQNNLNSLTAKVGEGADEVDFTEEAQSVERLATGIEKLNAVIGKAVVMEMPDIIPDDWLDRNREKIDEAVEEAMRLEAITEQMNAMLNSAIVNALSGATQAFVECVAGVEGADTSKILSAFLEPFASTLVSLGEMLLAIGVGITAFKGSLTSLNPAVAIGAGAALIALGTALSIGIQALGNSTGSSTATNSAAVSSSSDVSSQEFKTEHTIYVKGKISGSDIIIASDNQKNKWNK